VGFVYKYNQVFEILYQVWLLYHEVMYCLLASNVRADHIVTLCQHHHNSLIQAHSKIIYANTSHFLQRSLLPQRPQTDSILRACHYSLLLNQQVLDLQPVMLVTDDLLS